jgi:predicted N-acetyltransferase YhbS
MVTVRKLEPHDLHAVHSWFRHREGDRFDVEFLPKSGGFVAESDGALVACGYLMRSYDDEGRPAMALMEFLQVNHEVSEQAAGRGLLRIALFIEDLSRKLGFRYILGFTPENHFTLAKFYERQGARQYGKLMRLFQKLL